MGTIIKIFIFVFIIIILAVFIFYYGKYLLSGYKEAGGHKFKDIVIADLLGKNTGIGAKGEYYTYLKLLRYKISGSKILCNVYILFDNENSTEIDLILINKKGIYVFESKNYSGWIYGKSNEKTWCQSFRHKKQFFLNPILQNKRHIEFLNKLFDNKYSDSIHSYVVFSDRCRLKKVSYYGNERVVKRSYLNRSLNKDMINRPNLLTKEDINYIYNTLKDKTNVSETERLKHIHNLNKDN